jgi:putative transcriptional regulator
LTSTSGEHIIDGTAMAETIRNTVQRLRTTNGMTQEELACAVGVSRQTIIAIERGNYTPSVLLALKLGHVFKKPVESIFDIAYEK